MDLLKSTYEDSRRQAEKVRQDANTNIDKYFNELAEQATVALGANPQIEVGATLEEVRREETGIP
jgi:hypothetical protein